MNPVWVFSSCVPSCLTHSYNETLHKQTGDVSKHENETIHGEELFCKRMITVQYTPIHNLTSQPLFLFIALLVTLCMSLFVCLFVQHMLLFFKFLFWEWEILLPDCELIWTVNLLRLNYRHSRCQRCVNVSVDLFLFYICLCSVNYLCVFLYGCT